MKPQVFIDLDGVLADFDSRYEAVFGERNNHDAPEPPDFWSRLGAHADGHFYAELVLMPDARELWAGVSAMNPIVLTGIPRSLPHAEPDKRAWVARHFGADVQVICCASKDKCRYGRPGDVLIDDWSKYRHLWEEMGGLFILHTSAASSLDALSALSLESASSDPAVVATGELADAES